MGEQPLGGGGVFLPAAFLGTVGTGGFVNSAVNSTVMTYKIIKYELYLPNLTLHV